MNLLTVVKLSVGISLSRVHELKNEHAPKYFIYNQSDLEYDLSGVDTTKQANKVIRTADNVTVVRAGDVVFSLISGKAAIVTNKHEKYLLTQNYIILSTDSCLESKYLVYLLNENASIKRQFWIGMQGSRVFKYTLKQLQNLNLPLIPTNDRQKLIGEIYFKQQQLKLLREMNVKRKYELSLIQLEEVNDDERR